ncbi:MAG: class B sortase [Eubacterium sp.]|nr:class B sortase [Eubacterium sp.]
MTYQEKLRQERIRKNRMTNKILNILLVLFILIFVGSASYLGYYFYKINQAENDMNDVKSLILTDEDIVSEEEIAETAQETEEASPYIDIDGVSVLKKYSQIYKSNKDFIGWLNIHDTKIDYPVMYTPEDEQLYLRKNFSKEYSTAGTLFLAANSDPVEPSDNIIIYGHNMKAGTMFHTLLEYEDEEFYKAHKNIYFDTIYEKNTYEVIAAFRTVITDEDDSFKYYDFFEAANEEEFNAYVARAKELTPYNIDATASYGDKLLTLSTCAYHADSGRYVVVARRVVEDAEEDSDDGLE